MIKSIGSCGLFSKTKVMISLKYAERPYLFKYSSGACLDGSSYSVVCCDVNVFKWRWPIPALLFGRCCRDDVYPLSILSNKKSKHSARKWSETGVSLLFDDSPRSIQIYIIIIYITIIIFITSYVYTTIPVIPIIIIKK